MSLARLFRRRAKITKTEYGFDIRQFHLPADGTIEYAEWLHPYNQPQILRQELVDAVRQFVSAGDFAIDIGAHLGDTTVPIALATGGTGCTLALEPNPHVFKVLQVNSQLNPGRTNIVPLCCAATAEEGRFVFNYGDPAYNNGGFRSQQRWRLYRRRYPLLVRGVNLLQLLRRDFSSWLPKLSYIKVDAEGYDRVVLQSILPILTEWKPVIRTEVYRNLLAGERYAQYEFLRDAGYRVHRFQEGADPIGPALDRTDMTREKHFDILALTEERPQGRARLPPSRGYPGGTP